MLSSGMITPPFFIFPGNFTHSSFQLGCYRKENHVWLWVAEMDWRLGRILSWVLGPSVQYLCLSATHLEKRPSRIKNQDHAWKNNVQENPRRNLIIGSNFFVVSHTECTVPSFTDCTVHKIHIRPELQRGGRSYIECGWVCLKADTYTPSNCY